MKVKELRKEITQNDFSNAKYLGEKLDFICSKCEGLSNDDAISLSNSMVFVIENDSAENFQKLTDEIIIDVFTLIVSKYSESIGLTVDEQKAKERMSYYLATAHKKAK